MLVRLICRRKIQVVHRQFTFTVTVVKGILQMYAEQRAEHLQLSEIISCLIIRFASVQSGRVFIQQTLFPKDTQKHPDTV